MAVPSILQAGTQFFWVLPNGRWEGPLLLTRDREVLLLELQPHFAVYNLDDRLALVRTGEEGAGRRARRRPAPRLWFVRTVGGHRHILVHQDEGGLLHEIAPADPDADSLAMTRAFFAEHGGWLDLLHEPDRTFVKMAWGIA